MAANAEPKDVFVYRTLTAIRGYQNTTTTTHANGTAVSEAVSGTNAYRLAAGINRLFKVNKEGTLKNISTGLDPQLETNWADTVQCGDKFTLPTGLVAYDRTAFVGKPEGMYGVDEDGFGVPLIKRVARDVDNGRGMRVYEP